MSFTRILCPTDFSPGSQQALRVAARIATEANAELVVVHAWHIPPSAFAGEDMFPPHVIQEMIATRSVDSTKPYPGRPKTARSMSPVGC